MLLKWFMGLVVLMWMNPSAAQLLSRRKKIPVDSLRAPAEWESVMHAAPGGEESDRETEEFLPSLLQAGTDPLIRAATFDWGVVRYQWRGYNRLTPEYYINGAQLNNPLTGRIPWYVVNGMSSRIRTSQNGMGLQPVDYAPGNLLGSTYLESNSQIDRQQTGALVGFSGSRNALRYSCFHNTGSGPNGIAAGIFFQYVQASNSIRLPGSLRSFSGALTLEKNSNQRRTYLLLGFAPQESTKQPAVTNEIISITGNQRYNGNWGHQEEQVRFAGKRSYQFPFMVITHENRPTPYTRWRLAAAMMVGFQGDDGLDWYNAPDPRPDYYRYLPSFVADASLRQNWTSRLQQQPALLQIDWSKIYAINSASVTGNNLFSRRSRYVLERRVTHLKILSLNINYHTLIREKIDFSWGISQQIVVQRFQRKILDLLGGDHYLNINGFAESLHPTAGQYDILQPDRVLKTGDYFGYDYDFKFQSTNLWIQWQRAEKKWDWFVTGKGSRENLVRRGYVVNGLFPLNSGGTSKPVIWNTGQVKAGFTLKWQGRNFIYSHALFQTTAPLAEQIFLHPRYSHRLIDNSEVVASWHAELGWVYRSSRISSRIAGYSSWMQQNSEVQSFYSDQHDAPVNSVVTGLVYLHQGVEWSGSWQLHPDWEMDWAMVQSQNIFLNRPLSRLYHDLTENLLSSETIHLRGFRSGTGPQQALHVGIQYRSSGGWMFNCSINFLDQRWINIQPLRRTASAISSLPSGQSPEKWVLQEQLPAVWLFHGLIGYNWRVSKVGAHPVQMRCFISIRNLPGDHLLTGGYEQQRMNHGTDGQNLFPNKYFFTTGRYLTASLQIVI
ncbi:MAG: hypothetical protein ACKO1T_01795 [Sediminibacterium sp.]